MQNERAFQRQVGISRGYKKASRKTARQPGKAGNRWYKNVGLGFKTPKEAIEGTYIDKKCPYTGDVSIRGRILSGKVVSTKMHRTIVLRRDYLHYIKKYQRYEKRHTNISAHISPCFRCQEGDTVTVGQCRYEGLIRFPYLLTSVPGTRFRLRSIIFSCLDSLSDSKFALALQAAFQDCPLQCAPCDPRWIRDEEGIRWILRLKSCNL